MRVFLFLAFGYGAFGLLNRFKDDLEQAQYCVLLGILAALLEIVFILREWKK